MSRREKILPHIDKSGYGIEIGPFYSPIAPKREGYNVHIIDVMTREQLVGKKPSAGDMIEDVDFIWRGESYQELTGKRKYYDWIIGSHLIEHIPDLVGFFNDCDAILKDDGVLSLVIPDKRYCFDHFRPISGLSQIIDSHYHKNRTHTPGSIIEYRLHRVRKAGKNAWDPSFSGTYNFTESLEDDIQNLYPSAVKETAYRDCHAWCFVPHSFRLIVHDLFSLGLIPFQEVDFSPTEGSEFFIALGRKGKGINKSRLEMLEIIDSECKARDSEMNSLIKRLTKPIRKAGKYISKRLT